MWASLPAAGSRGRSNSATWLERTVSPFENFTISDLSATISFLSHFMSAAYLGGHVIVLTHKHYLLDPIMISFSLLYLILLFCDLMTPGKILASTLVTHSFFGPTFTIFVVTLMPAYQVWDRRPDRDS